MSSSSTELPSSAKCETDQKLVDVGVIIGSSNVRVSKSRQQKLCDGNTGLMQQSTGVMHWCKATRLNITSITTYKCSTDINLAQKQFFNLPTFCGSSRLGLQQKSLE